MNNERVPAEVRLTAGLGRDAETLRGLDGLHLALLDDEEKQAFQRLQDAGMARREYSGAAGLLGIARLRLVPAA
jgi:hypothetical protein